MAMEILLPSFVALWFGAAAVIVGVLLLFIPSAPTTERRGTLRFSVPILGADEWPFICSDEVASGDRVRVSDISGNDLIVIKV